MPDILYITADEIGIQTGGGVVTKHEKAALTNHGDVLAFGNECVAYTNGCLDPFRTDLNVREKVERILQNNKIRLAHFYSGSFTETIKLLKSRGTKITYTVAAHNVDISRDEHIKLGYNYPYPHLNDPGMFKMYIEGYALADVAIVPSKLSADCLKMYGCTNIKIIPHGGEWPTTVAPVSNRFNVGYLGQYGPDKGVVYLLKAWAKLNYVDSSLILAGRNISNFLPIIRKEGGGNIHIAGFVESTSDLYNKCSVYVQPSASEGFGIEIIEAMMHRRPVITSTGAGACDIVDDGITGYVVPALDHNKIAEKIDILKNNRILLNNMSQAAISKAPAYTWNNVIHNYYRPIWADLLRHK